MMKPVLWAALLMTLVTAGGAVASDESQGRSATEMFEMSEAPDLTFDRRNESAQSPWTLASMASTIAAYMKAHPRAELRIDLILASLIDAGVSVDSIRFGPR